jgi:hypothetical protein
MTPKMKTPDAEPDAAPSGDAENMQRLLAQVNGKKNESSDSGSEYRSNQDEFDDGTTSIETTDDIPEEFLAQFQEHLALLTNRPEEAHLNAMNSAPLFTGSVWRQVEALRQGHEASASIQYGLLGGNVEMLCKGMKGKADPRVFHNVTTPMSTFICGSQGSGKSHTLSCLLENCMVSSPAAVLPRPLTGVVFHYDTFTSDTGGSPCEAAYLSSNSNVRVRVLCAPTNVQTIKVRVTQGSPDQEESNADTFCYCRESMPAYTMLQLRSCSLGNRTSTRSAC